VPTQFSQETDLLQPFRYASGTFVVKSIKTLYWTDEANTPSVIRRSPPVLFRLIGLRWHANGLRFSAAHVDFTTVDFTTFTQREAARASCPAASLSYEVI
jgi:hypothetical protein